jgi:hypothetical protein
MGRTLAFDHFFMYMVTGKYMSSRCSCGVGFFLIVKANKVTQANEGNFLLDCAMSYGSICWSSRPVNAPRLLLSAAGFTPGLKIFRDTPERGFCKSGKQAANYV